MNEANTLTKTEFDYEIPEFNPSVIVKQKELSSEEVISLFKKVSNKEHWKGEIKAVIPAKDLDKYNQAVMEYTGGLLEPVSDEDENGMIHVYSEGYWVNIGA
jgi:hypothetical protein